jgi:hypothetical protein
MQWAEEAIEPEVASLVLKALRSSCEASAPTAVAVAESLLGKLAAWVSYAVESKIRFEWRRDSFGYSIQVKTRMLLFATVQMLSTGKLVLHLQVTLSFGPADRCSARRQGQEAQKNQCWIPLAAKGSCCTARH